MVGIEAQWRATPSYGKAANIAGITVASSSGLHAVASLARRRVP